MTLAELETALHGACIDDILMAGLLDESTSPVEMIVLEHALYLRCGAALVEIEAIDSTGRLRIRLVDARSAAGARSIGIRP